jgi:hypothetical protein
VAARAARTSVCGGWCLRLLEFKPGAGRDRPGLPSAAARAARASVCGGVAIAHQLKSASLLASARAAFVHGMDTTLLVSAGISAPGNCDKMANGRRSSFHESLAPA